MEPQNDTTSVGRAIERDFEGEMCAAGGSAATQRPRIPHLLNRAFFIRSLALLCACSLSIGSHYASYILSPLKSRLAREMGTSNTEFSLLLSAYSLNSTWTPLVGGLIASKLGTTFSSILATSIILIGQMFLLAGDTSHNVRLMALGMFIFGFGTSPLAVVQESIIVRFFKSHGLGVSMALGLVAGKGASFVSARTSYPLTERFGPHAPFYVATFLATLSVVVNLVYILSAKFLVKGAGAELEATEISEEARMRMPHSLTEAQALEKVAAKRRVHLREITRLGDTFWFYIGLNVLCGAIWSPFTHLAANIIEVRYGMTEQDSSTQASYLLAGSLVFYPICGYIVDRIGRRRAVLQLLLLSSFFTLLCYGWLVLPPRLTKTAFPATVAFAIGHGFSPLLLVLIVPQIVDMKYVSTALGAHKSLEQTGSTLAQTLAGLSLDTRGNRSSFGTTPFKKIGDSLAVQHLLQAFLVLNVLQFSFILGMLYLDRRHQVSISTTAMDRAPLLASDTSPDYMAASVSSAGMRRDVGMRGRMRRGKICAFLCMILILSAWTLFLATAWMRLRSKQDREKIVDDL